MTEVESLRQQLEDARKMIVSLSKENSDLKAFNAYQEVSVGNGAKYSLRLEFVGVFEKLRKDTATIVDTHAYARDTGYNEAIEQCLSIVKP